jgi:hypothetical protein
MTIKLAKENLGDNPIEISFEEIMGSVDKDVASTVFYLDQENSHKSILDLVDKIQNEGFKVYQRELKYGLANDEYMYEVQVLSYS